MFRFDPNLFHKSCLDQSGPIFDVIIKQPFLPACFGHAAFGQLSQPVSILRPIQSNLVIIAIDRTGNRNSPVRLAYCYFFFAGDDYKAAIFWVIALRVRSRNFQVNDSPLNKIGHGRDLALEWSLLLQTNRRVVMSNFFVQVRNFAGTALFRDFILVTPHDFHPLTAFIQCVFSPVRVSVLRVRRLRGQRSRIIPRC